MRRHDLGEIRRQAALSQWVGCTIFFTAETILCSAFLYPMVDIFVVRRGEITEETVASLKVTCTYGLALAVPMLLLMVGMSLLADRIPLWFRILIPLPPAVLIAAVLLLP